MIRGYGADAVRAAEAPALAAGEPLMRNAAFALATSTVALLRSRSIAVPGARALVLAGGGNNGGDGLFAAADLCARGVQVTCLLAHHTPHPEGLAAARRAGAHLVDLTPGIDGADLTRLATDAHVWLDALAGIGVQGALRGLPAEVVRALRPLRTGATGNARRPLVVAVDTPSGIGADPLTEPVPDDGVLAADLTVTMGAPKAALLLPPGAQYAGEVQVVDLGLAEDFGAQQPAVCRLTPADVAARWPVPGPADHKYTRGVLGLSAGSARYPGAALLCARAALGMGLGMVRYLGDPEVAHAVIGTHPEVVTEPGRVQARVIGPGMADDDELAAAMRLALRGWGLRDQPAQGEPSHEDSTAGDFAADASAPADRENPAAKEEGVAVVLDAGALAHLPDAPGTLIHHPVVLTPHAGELRDLLVRLGTEVTREQIEADPWRWAHAAARRTGATVLLKGSITIIAPPGSGSGDSVPGGTVPGFSQADGSPWLATAGSGDVLAGILGAVLAQAARGSIGPGDVAALVATAVVVHGRAAALAGGPLRAGHLAEAVPAAIASLLDRAALDSGR